MSQTKTETTYEFNKYAYATDAYWKDTESAIILNKDDNTYLHDVIHGNKRYTYRRVGGYQYGYTDSGEYYWSFRAERIDLTNESVHILYYNNTSLGMLIIFDNGDYLHLINK